MVPRFQEIPGYGVPQMLSADPFQLAANDTGGEAAKLTAPEQFRIFRAGINKSSKGDWLFDQKAADSVMRAFREKGSTLTMDYEHQALVYPPIEAPASCSSWVPEIRQTSEGPELWATSVHWTPRAKLSIESREYTRFSPAFTSEPKTNRILKIVNGALTNTEALFNFATLVAANETNHMNHGAHMKCTVCSENIGDDETAMHASHGKPTGASAGMMLTALSIMGMKTDAKEPELIESLGELTSLRAAVVAITGKREPAEIIGVLNAWKSNGAQIATLTEQLAVQATVSLRASAEAMVKTALEAGKIKPGGREMSKIVDDEIAPYVALRDGKFDGKVVAALKANLEARDKVVANTKIPENDGSTVALTQDECSMADSMGIPREDWKKFKATQIADAAARA